jgi:phosphoserine aminotransferase
MSNKIYFTPGPSQLFYSFNDHFKEAINKDIPSISHRSKAFISTVTETVEALKELFALPEGYHVFFLNSANEAWDRILQNLVVERAHFFTNGYFSKKFYDFGIEHQLKCTKTETPFGHAFNDLTIPADIELLGITKNETSVGYSFKEEEIMQIRHQTDALIALDMVSAAPSLPIDFSNVDTAYLSVQKAFGMPAGLGIWIANEKCIEKAAKVKAIRSTGSYRALDNLKKFGAKNQTPETPNMLFIYILGAIARDILNYGVSRMRSDTVYKARLIQSLVERHPMLELFVSSKEHRSDTTIVANASDNEKIITALEQKNMIIGKGYGDFKEKHIRIANFPTHSKESIEFLVDSLSEIE